MFELTINGKTEQFKTAAEMEEWRQRMTSPIRHKKKHDFRKKNKRSSKKN